MWADRFDPVEATVLLVIVLPFLVIGSIRQVCSRDAAFHGFLVLGFGLLAWMSLLQVTLVTAHPSGWWRICERAAALVLVLAMVGSGCCSRVLLHHLGAASALTAVVVAILNRLHGHVGDMNTTCFAYGHVNVFANTVGPVLWAWCAFLISEKQFRRDRGWLVLAALGSIAFAVVAIDTGRRGAALGISAAGGLLALMWIWRRSRAVALVLVAGLLVVTWSIGVRLFADPVPTLRNERVALYRAGWHTAIEGLPWGFGHYGALQVQTGANESARHLTATGTWGTHIHNEFLDALLDGGPIALALVIGLGVLGAFKISRVSDSSQRRAAVAGAAAVFVHLMTDNVYGTEVGQVWLGLAAGIVWAMPSVAVQQPALRLLIWPIPVPSVRLIAWPLVLLATWGAMHAIYPAVLHRDAYPSVHVLCLRQALDPTSVQMRAAHVLMFTDPPVDEKSKAKVVKMAVEKMGWTPTMAAAEANYRWSEGPPAETVTALLRLVRMNPFRRKAYQLLAELVVSKPEVVDLIPPRIARRLLWLTAQPKVAAMPLPVRFPGGIEDAADAYALITRAITLGEPWSTVDAPLIALVKEYGDVPDVAELAVRSRIVAPADSLEKLLDCAATLLVGFRYQSDVPGLFAEVVTPDQARRVLPLLERLYPFWFGEWKAGRSGIDLKGEADPVYLGLQRIRGLAG